jgi:hypothetical protein
MTAGGGHGTLLAEVFGDASNSVIRLRFIDQGGQFWEGAPAVVSWAGWKTIYADTRSLRSAGPRSLAPVDLRLPARFYSLLVEAATPAMAASGIESAGSGELGLGRIQFGSE